jgi:hypothetical protein
MYSPAVSTAGFFFYRNIKKTSQVPQVPFFLTWDAPDPLKPYTYYSG